VLRIVPATERDLPLILHFIQDLAEYERLREHAVVTLEDLRRWLFGSQKAAEVVIGYVDDEPAGFALYFQNFSTFLGKPGLYLEDLFVLPAWRGRGLGRKLLVHLARIAVDRGYGRMEWSVLDWNELALRVYRQAGAEPLTDWTVHRLAGDALTQLAREGDPSPPQISPSS
jgi:GNAT superfamily N-acetyltransferase